MSAQDVVKGPGWRVPFFSIWTGQQVSLIGSGIAQFALVWWLTERTGSATVLAMGTMMSLLPGVILGPLVGALVDRWDRRTTMVVADGVVALLSAGLAYLFWRSTIQTWQIYVILLGRAVGGVFHWPAMQASTSLMVPRRHLPRVSGLNQAIGGAMGIASPPIGALLVGVLPFHTIMAIDVVTAGVAILPLLVMRIPRLLAHEPCGRSGEAPSVWADMRQGLSYVWQWPSLLVIIGGSMTIQLFIAPAISLVPILVTRHFGGQAMELGWMNAAWGAGLVGGGLLLSLWGGFRKRVVTMLVGTMGLGVGFLVAGLAPANRFPLGLAGIWLGAACLSMANGAVFALLQQTVQAEMQGRVFTLIMSLSNGLAPLGMALAGPAADMLGAQAWFVVGGLASVLLGTVSFLSPTVMRLEEDGQQGAGRADIAAAAASS